LRGPETWFLIVTSPESGPAAEALFLSERLAAVDMSADALIINRTHLDGLGGHQSDEVVGLLAGELGDPLAERVASNLADFDVLARRDRDTIERLASAVRGSAPIVIPQLDEDVEDLLGLARVAEHLFE